eukprot:scaffold61763_cov20-Tisochrysis_lutea.AAC.4
MHLCLIQASITLRVSALGCALTLRALSLLRACVCVRVSTCVFYKCQMQASVTLRTSALTLGMPVPSVP